MFCAYITLLELNPATKPLSTICASRFACLLNLTACSQATFPISLRKSR